LVGKVSDDSGFDRPLSFEEAIKRVGAREQIRVDLRSMRPVRLIEPSYDETENGTRIYQSWWVCEDLVTEEWYRINMRHWGDELNIMELLAWVSK
jgi:hypothetical protein